MGGGSFASAGRALVSKSSRRGALRSTVDAAAYCLLLHARGPAHLLLGCPRPWGWREGGLCGRHGRAGQRRAERRWHLHVAVCQEEGRRRLLSESASHGRASCKKLLATMLDVSRVQKELVEIERDKNLSGVSIAICEDDLARMRGTITGPVGTPYEGGIFSVDIHLPCAFLLLQLVLGLRERPIEITVSFLLGPLQASLVHCGSSFH